MGHIPAAIAEYQAVLKIQPEYAEAYYNLGIIYAARGQRGDAEACYRAALKIKPEFPEVQRSLKALLAGARSLKEGTEVVVEGTPGMQKERWRQPPPSPLQPVEKRGLAPN